MGLRTVVKRRAGEAALVLGTLLGASAFLIPLRNPDVYWHLSAGRRIAELGVVPRADWLSHTLAGRSWVDFEWLTELSYHAAFAAAGWNGLLALRLALLGAATWLLLALLRRGGAPAAARGLAALWLGAALSYGGDLRPDNYSLLFFTALLAALEAERARRPIPRGLRLAGFAAFFCAWSNLHLGFTSGLALLVLYALAEPRRGRELWEAAAAAAAGCLLNPFGSSLAVVLLEHVRHRDLIRGLIHEWGPLDAANGLDQPGLALAAAGAAAVLLRAARERKAPRGLGASALFFAAAACAQRRQVLFAAPVCLAALFDSAPALASARALRAAGTAAAAALALHLGLRIWPQLPRDAAGLRPVPAIEGAVAFLERERPALGPRRLYNEVADGGYLGWRLRADYPVFCDGRYLFYPLLAEASRAAASPGTWTAFLRERRVDLALAHPTSRRLAEYFPAPEWSEVYRDASAVILARRGAIPAN